MRWNSILLGIALLAPTVYAADGSGQTRSVAELRTFYQARCAACHGEDGSARTPSGGKLRGFDFTDAKAMRKADDDAFAKAIRKGIFFGLSMPAFAKELNDAETALLVKEILRKAEKGRKIASVP